MNRIVLFAFVPVLAVCGCGPELPETVHVEGKIIYKGEAVAHAQVGFVPKNEDTGALPALGETDEDGVFVLRTYVSPGHEANGAMPGDYAVTVQKTDVPDDPAKMSEMLSKNPGYVPPQLLPSQYATASLSPLSAPVTDDGDNNFEFELAETPAGRTR